MTTTTTDIRVGDKVRARQGRIVWTVDRVGEYLGKQQVWMHSERSKRRAPASRLVVVERSRQDSNGVASASPVLTFESDGAVTGDDGEVVRASDSCVEVVTEWQTPVMSGVDPDDPSQVSAVVWHDREGRNFMEIRASGFSRSSAALTRQTVIEFVAKLTTLAAQLT